MVGRADETFDQIYADKYRLFALGVFVDFLNTELEVRGHGQDDIADWADMVHIKGNEYLAETRALILDYMNKPLLDGERQKPKLTEQQTRCLMFSLAVGESMAGSMGEEFMENQELFAHAALGYAILILREFLSVKEPDMRNPAEIINETYNTRDNLFRKELGR